MYKLACFIFIPVAKRKTCTRKLHLKFLVLTQYSSHLLSHSMQARCIAGISLKVIILITKMYRNRLHLVIVYILQLLQALCKHATFVYQSLKLQCFFKLILMSYFSYFLTEHASMSHCPRYTLSEREENMSHLISPL